jgi:hypothetical protein
VIKQVFVAIFLALLASTHLVAVADSNSTVVELETSTALLSRMLISPAIRADLALTDEQVAQIEPLSAKLPLTQPLAPVSEAMTPFAPILSDVQLAGLKAYVIAGYGARAFAVPEVQESLRLTDDQRLAIIAILWRLKSDLQPYQQLLEQGKVGDVGALTRDTQPLWDKAYDEAMALLNADQLRLWKTIAKPPYRARRPR